MTENLENKISTHVSLYFIELIILSVTMFVFIEASMIIIITIFLLSFVFHEMIVRCVFYLKYKDSYKNKLLSPILIDNPLYGYSFPKCFNSKKYKKLLFENFLFKPNKSKTNLNKNIENRVLFSTNSYGFRGVDLLQGERKVRVFCCGGSTTACDSCDDSETWPYFLNKKFNNAGHEVEVINAGIQGWYSFHDLLRIKNEIINLKPNVLILHEGWNEEFEYSSLNLGKDWRPNTVRSYLNANVFYKKSSGAFARTLNNFFSYYLVKKIFLSRAFKKQMNFTNISRWESLRRHEYLEAWLGVLKEIRDIAYHNRIHVYMVDPPSLVEIDDDRVNRSIYISNSRLDKWFADYQAVSSSRTSNFLKFIDTFIPVINCKRSFKKFSGIDRIKLFYDEIHLTPLGNKVLADTIFSFLTKNKEFLSVLNNEFIERKVDIDIDSIKSEATTNPKNVEKYIDKIILHLTKIKTPQKKGSIPTDRYTTF